MVFTEFALSYVYSLIYDSSKELPKAFSDTYSKAYDQAIEEFSNKNYKLTGIQIDTFFHQKNVENAIKKYLKYPDKLDCADTLIHEFFELFSEEDFSRKDADLILNSFFEILDAEIEKDSEFRNYLKFYLAKQTYQTVQEIHKEISGSKDHQDKKEESIDEESLKKYLNKIIDEENKSEISEVYTELSAKEILPISLKFHDKEKDRTQEFEVLELVEKEEKLIISGESGSGKTTTLRWLNFTFAAKYLKNKEGSIPLYVELNSYIKGSFYDYFKHQVKKKSLPEVSLKAILEGKAIILLDGLDLLSSTESFFPYDEISNFISEYSNCRFIVSSRLGFFESVRNDFKVSELEKLTDEKIQIFIEKYVEEKKLAAILKIEILCSPKLKSILTNPMMLYLAIKVAVERKRSNFVDSFTIEDLFPQNRSELYEIFISNLFKHTEKNRRPLNADKAQIENALKDLFFKLQCRNKVSCKYSDAQEIFQKHAVDPKFRKTTSQDILEDSIKLGLLTKNDSEIGYGIHQSFQEYFAAIRLKELFDAGFDVSEAFNHPKWEEVVIFTFEMLSSDSIDEFVELMLSKGDLFLASRCVNKASDGIKEKLCNLLTNKIGSIYKLDKINSIKCLGKIGTLGVSIISEALKDDDYFVRIEAERALEKIKSETAVKPLINIMNDENEHLMKKAERSRKGINSEALLQLLINALTDGDEYIRMNAAESLGNLRSEKAVQPLINALKDKDQFVRGRAVWALGNIKSEAAVQPLIDSMKNQDRYVRWRAAEALGNIKSEAAVQPLINALKDKDRYVRQSTAEALGKIKSKKAVQPLINALNDKDYFVHESVVRALENIKSEAAVQPLINTMESKDRSVRRRAVEALGNIKSEIAVKPLINALKDEDHFVRQRAAEALGNIKSEIAVQPLIDAMKDENVHVRQMAAWALGYTKSETAVQPLINSMESKDRYVWQRAAEALRKICTVKNKKQLENLLKSEYEFSANTAYEILYEIEKEEKSKIIIFEGDLRISENR